MSWLDTININVPHKAEIKEEEVEKHFKRALGTTTYSLPIHSDKGFTAVTARAIPQWIRPIKDSHLMVYRAELLYADKASPIMLMNETYNDPLDAIKAAIEYHRQLLIAELNAIHSEYYSWQQDIEIF